MLNSAKLSLLGAALGGIVGSTQGESSEDSKRLAMQGAKMGGLIGGLVPIAMRLGGSNVQKTESQMALDKLKKFRNSSTMSLL